MQAHNKVLWDQRRERNYFGERSRKTSEKKWHASYKLKYKTDLPRWSKRREIWVEEMRLEERCEKCFYSGNKHSKWIEHGVHKSKILHYYESKCFARFFLNVSLLPSICTLHSHHWYMVSFTLLPSTPYPLCSPSYLPP